MISLLYALFKLLLIFRDQESYDDITKNISISRDITKIPPIISTQKHMIHELWQSKKNVFFCDSISSQFPLLQNMQSNMPLFLGRNTFSREQGNGTFLEATATPGDCEHRQRAGKNSKNFSGGEKNLVLGRIV